MLIQLRQVTVPVTLSFTIITMALLHLTASRAMETVKLALIQLLHLEQAVLMHMQLQQTPVLVLAY